MVAAGFDQIENLEFGSLAEVPGQMQPDLVARARAETLDVLHQGFEQRGVLGLVHDHAGLDDVLHLKRREPTAALLAQLVEPPDELPIAVEDTDAGAQRFGVDRMTHHFLELALQAGQAFDGATMGPRVVHRGDQLVENHPGIRQLHADRIRGPEQLHAVIAEQDHIEQGKVALRRLVHQAAGEPAVEWIQQSVPDGDGFLGFLQDQRQRTRGMSEFAWKVHREGAHDLAAGALFPRRRVFQRTGGRSREWRQIILHIDFPVARLRAR